MPEYLAPGVYVEETSFRSRSIEGVGTSTCAFVGPTRKGPLVISPELLTSFADYERIYGGLDDLAYGSDALLNRNYVAHAVSAFFNNGGSRLYVVRVAPSDAATANASATPVLPLPVVPAPNPLPPATAWFVAATAGSQFNGAQLTLQQSATPIGRAGLALAPEGTLVRVAVPTGATLGFWFKQAGVWVKSTVLTTTQAAPAAPVIADLAAEFDANKLKAQALTVNVTVVTTDGTQTGFGGLATGFGHPQYIGDVLSEAPSSRSAVLSNPVALHIAPGAAFDADALLGGLGGGDLTAGGQEPSKRFALVGGADGSLPIPADYAKALALLVGLEDVSNVAAPGHSARYTEAAPEVYLGIQDALITHVSGARRYRIAVLDAPPGVTPTQMRDLRGHIDSTRAALYYPWIVVNNPLAGPNSNAPAEITLPPSGHVCGIYARTDQQRGVWKAPANEVVLGALRFEPDVNFAQQELLNPIGVNCLRYLSGRGYRVWGARTVASDPEWKYVNVRRYFNYLEASIDRGTQWAVFEPNGDALWQNVRGTIGDFLFNEWKNGALLGTKPEQAFFVRCDRTTMTQNDLDNGRLICLVGVAVVKPAEFVIFRIGQKTADAAN